MSRLETMFDVRRAPWAGLGTDIKTATNSDEALRYSGLDWVVEQEDVYLKDSTFSYAHVPGYKLNIRDKDRTVLGLVSDQYKVVQNTEAFAFTNHLLGENIKYETAGSLSSGRRVWLQAQLPTENILGDEVQMYLVFSNTHDGTGAVKVAVTPIRVVCQNILNIALKEAARIWSVRHTGDIAAKLHEAERTLSLTEKYLVNFRQEAGVLADNVVHDGDVGNIIEIILPIPADAGAIKEKNVLTLREGLLDRYNNAPDLGKFRGTAWGFVNAVSDFATHIKPRRRSDTFRENLFVKTVDGNALIDHAYALLVA